MEVHLTPEQQAHLAEIAHHEGKDPEELVKDATLHLLEEDRRQCETVRERIAQADLGEFIEETEMDIRFKKILRA